MNKSSHTLSLYRCEDGEWSLVKIIEKKKMQTSTVRFQFYVLGFTNQSNSIANSQTYIPIKTKSNLKTAPRKKGLILPTRNNPLKIRKIENPIILKSSKDEVCANGYLRFVVVGAATVGFVLLVLGMDEQKAMALGPQGPLMEEFWDNVRRYALYALTVSTGALYTILQPIVELLKNPISAVLIILIFGGSFYIISQVLSAMVGATDFSYDYGY